MQMWSDLRNGTFVKDSAITSEPVDNALRPFKELRDRQISPAAEDNESINLDLKESNKRVAFSKINK